MNIKNTLIIAFLLLLLVGCSEKNTPVVTTEYRLLKASEYAYFEGQKDALNGDIAIKWDEEADCWRWIKSPWNNGSPLRTDASGFPND